MGNGTRWQHTSRNDFSGILNIRWPESDNGPAWELMQATYQNDSDRDFSIKAHYITSSSRGAPSLKESFQDPCI